MKYQCAAPICTIFLATSGFFPDTGRATTKQVKISKSENNNPMKFCILYSPLFYSFMHVAAVQNPPVSGQWLLSLLFCIVHLLRRNRMPDRCPFRFMKQSNNTQRHITQSKQRTSPYVNHLAQGTGPDDFPLRDDKKQTDQPQHTVHSDKQQS